MRYHLCLTIIFYTTFILFCKENKDWELIKEDVKNNKIVIQAINNNDIYRVKNRKQFESCNAVEVDYENIALTQNKIIAIGSLDNIKKVALLSTIDGHKADNANLILLVKNYKNITSLTIEVEGNTITNKGLQEISTSKKLQELRMSFLLNTKITDSGYTFLSNLKELELFSVDQINFATKGLKSVSKLNKLQIIYISNSKKLKNEDFISLKNTKSIKEINIRFCKNVTDDIRRYFKHDIKITVSNN